MANNKIKFLRGTSDEYTAAEKDNDTIYFTTDDGKLYVGDKEVSGESIKALNSHINDNVKHITSTERTNWNAAKTHADSPHAPSNAQANVIETVKVNGTALTPSSKAVNITVPSVGNGTITITQNGTTKGTFTTNQSGNTTIDLDGGGSSVDNIDGIPVDLTGIYNTQVIGYDEESGKLVPMINVARTVSIKNDTIEVIESDGYVHSPYSSSSNHYMQFTKTDVEYKYVTFQLKESYLLSEFVNLKITSRDLGGSYDPYGTLDIMLSKSEDFSTIDCNWHFDVSTGFNQDLNILNFIGKYYIRIKIYSKRALVSIESMDLS